MNTTFVLPKWVTVVLRVYLVAALPLVLVLVNARLLFTQPFANWEYTRPGFPPDPFGFSTQERLTYASSALDYLFNNQGIDFLAKQTMPDSTPLYSPPELSHMVDAKNVTQMLLIYVGPSLAGIYVIVVVLLALSPNTRPRLYHALVWAGIVTIAVILIGMVLTATSFDWLFTEFHRLFFTGNTWLFPVSDTLIRLFPEQLWIDWFALMFGGALLEGALIGGAMAWAIRRGAKNPVQRAQ